MQFAAGEFCRLLVMGDHHDGLALPAIEHLEQGKNFVGGFAIQIAGWLVAQKNGRVGDDGAGDADPLLLSPRHFARLVRRAVPEPHQGQRGIDMGLALGAGEAGEQQRQFDIGRSRQHRHQIVELEDKADMAGAPARKGGMRQRFQMFARDDGPPGLRPVQPADQVEDGGLARPGRPHQGGEFALGYPEIEVLQHRDPLPPAPIGFGDLPQENGVAGIGAVWLLVVALPAGGIAVEHRDASWSQTSPAAKAAIWLADFSKILPNSRNRDRYVDCGEIFPDNS